MNQPKSVALNDVPDLIRFLEEGGLGEALASGCTGRCGTRCGSRTALEEELRELPLAEQVALKKERIRQLQQQVEEAEKQLAQGGKASSA